MSRSRHSATYVGTLDVVLIVFVIMKLVGVVEWSWWAVLSPLWLGAALAFFAYLITDH